MHKLFGHSCMNSLNPAIHAQDVLPSTSVFQHKSLINSTFNIITSLTFNNCKLHTLTPSPQRPGRKHKHCITHTSISSALRAVCSDQTPPFFSEHSLTPFSRLLLLWTPSAQAPRLAKCYWALQDLLGG